MTFVQQVAHVFRNDTRRFLPLLVAVIAFMGLHVGGYFPSTGLRPVVRILPIGLLPLLLGLLAAMVVQHDSPVDDKAFWTTRPLRPASVLLAKLAFVGVFLVGLPVLVQAVWFTSMGVGREVAPISADSALYLGSILVVAAVCGAVTRTIRGVLAAAVVVWFGVSVLGAGQRFYGPDQAGSMMTQKYLELWMWLLIAVGLLGHQYITRRTWHTLGLGAIAVFTLVPFARSSSLDWATDESLVRAEVRPALTGDQWGGGDAIEVSLVNLRRDQKPRPDGERLDDGLAATLAFSGGSGALLEVRHVVTHITGAGADLEFSTPAGDLSAPARRFVRPDIPGMRLAARRVPMSMPARAWIAVDENNALDELPGTERLALSVTFDAFEPQVLGRMPIEAGGLMHVPSGTLILHVVEKSSRTVRIEVGHRWRVYRMLLRDGSDGFEDRTSFALYSPRYNEFIMDNGGGSGGRQFSLTGGATVFEPSRWLEFEARFAERRDGPPLPDDWFEDVELVALSARHVGSFTRTIERTIKEWPTGMIPVTIDGYPVEPPVEGR